MLRVMFYRTKTFSLSSRFVNGLSAIFVHVINMTFVSDTISHGFSLQDSKANEERDQIQIERLEKEKQQLQ